MRESIPVHIGACFLVDSPTVIPREEHALMKDSLERGNQPRLRANVPTGVGVPVEAGG